jgi:hypothetical protein
MKYILVYMYREAASQGEKQGIKTPTMEQLINPDLKTMQFGVY